MTDEAPEGYVRTAPVEFDPYMTNPIIDPNWSWFDPAGPEPAPNWIAEYLAYHGDGCPAYRDAFDFEAGHGAAA